jgi:hypothetical protein
MCEVIMVRGRWAVHRTIFVVDVAEFGDRRRTNPHQVVVRRGVYRALQKAFARSGISWRQCYHEDRGDGVLVLASANVRKSRFVDVLPQHLVTALEVHKAMCKVEERIRLRVAVHAGELLRDRYGVTGAALNLAFRLLNADVAKTALDASTRPLALVVLSWFFDEVVRHVPGIDLASYRPIQVNVKETSTIAWLTVGGRAGASTMMAAPPPAASARLAPRQLPAHPAHLLAGAANCSG